MHTYLKIITRKHILNNRNLVTIKTKLMLRWVKGLKALLFAEGYQWMQRIYSISYCYDLLTRWVKTMFLIN